MPFGLTNAPTFFQALINDILRKYLNNFVVAYLNDILIFSKIYKKYVEHIKKILTKLRKKDLSIKFSKCEFYKHTIEFLDYKMSDKKIGPNSNKVKFIEKWPKPTNITEI